MIAGASWRRPDMRCVVLLGMIFPENRRPLFGIMPWRIVQDWLFFSTFQNTGAGVIGMPSMFLRVAAG